VTAPPSDDPTGPQVEEEAASAPETDADATATDERGLEAVPEAEPGPAARIETLEREIAELNDRLLRRRAEFENFRRRAQRDGARAADDGAAELLKELLPALDDLERALLAPGGDAVREGVELIYKNLTGTLKSRGLHAEDPRGRAFDPEIHEAVAHEPAPGVSPGTIVEVFQKGYLFKDRLLRPALVKVAAESEASEDAEPVH
jgi:molecular chaperone GrpE